MKKIIKLILIAFSVLLLGNFIVHAINTQMTGFRITKTTPKVVNVWDQCKKITNKSNIGDAFIPTHSKTEWGDLLQKNPSHLDFSGCLPTKWFVTNWTIGKQGYGNGSLDLTFHVGGNDIYVDWGDGVIEQIKNNNPYHRYAQPGEYTVKIGNLNRFETSNESGYVSDKFNSFQFKDCNSKYIVDNINYKNYYYCSKDHFAGKLISVKDWGDTKWASAQNMFNNAKNLETLPSKAPNLKNVSNASKMFQATASFNQSINHWDISNIDNLSNMFRYSVYNQPLDKWDTSNVKKILGIFSFSKFNQPINTWDLGIANNFSRAFMNSDFNQPIGNWDVSNVLGMGYMFKNSKFNQPIGNWNVSRVVDMSGMFYDSDFNQPIGDWNVSNVDDMSRMFSSSKFNQPIGNWNVSNVTDMSSMFSSSKFNQPIGNWNVSSLKNMNTMFGWNRNFNQPLGNWDVSNVRDMTQLFAATNFNQPIGNWDLSSAITTRSMFRYSPFNQNISNWNVSNVKDMSFMFSSNSFNYPIGDWDVSNVRDMTAMFYINRSFNQDISKWNVENVKKYTWYNSRDKVYYGMFDTATSFNQDLSDWNIRNDVSLCTEFAENAHNWTKPKPVFTSCDPGY